MEVGVVRVPVMPELRLAIAKLELASELELTRYDEPMADLIREVRRRVDLGMADALLHGSAAFEPGTMAHHDRLRRLPVRVPADELRPPCPECGGYPSAVPDGWRCRECGEEYA